MLKPLLGCILMAVLVTAKTARPQADANENPTNDLPNFYRAERPLGQLLNKQVWGWFGPVAIDRNGKSVWVADRCGVNPNTPANVSSFLWDRCTNSSADPIHKFESSENLQISLGTNMLVFPSELSHS
jgi:hypothetical protein